MRRLFTEPHKRFVLNPVLEHDRFVFTVDKVAVVRQTLEKKFRATIDRDVSLIAAEYCEDEALPKAAERCRTSNKIISSYLWSEFTFDWQRVRENPGGTAGRMTRFITAKLEYTVAWAVAGDRETAEVSNAKKVALENLHLLWLEWAGHMVTTNEESSIALGE